MKYSKEQIEAMKLSIPSWEAAIACANQAYAHYNKQFDLACIGVLEALEDRVPTNEELSEYAAHFLFPDGDRGLNWKGVLVLKFPSFSECYLTNHSTVEP